MAKRTYVVDLHKTTFPFGQEYVDNKADPLGDGIYSNMNNAIQVIDLANAIPTPEGMASFFGANPLNLPPLGYSIEHAFIFRDQSNNNTLIALGNDGALFSLDGVTWDTTQATLPSNAIVGGIYKLTMADRLTETLVGYLPAILTITDTATLVADTIPVSLPMHIGATIVDTVSLSLLLTADPLTPLPAAYTATISYVYKTITHNLTIATTATTIDATYVEQPIANIPLPVKAAWSWCVLDRRLYIGREGASHILRMSLDGLTWELLVPNFVTITNVAGIFAARGRLGLWDIAGAIYTSSDIDPMDFTPSVSTLANVVTPTALQGRIISILGKPEGFVIYATSSILEAVYTGGSEVFRYLTVSDMQGVLSPLSCTAMATGDQYVITGDGVYLIRGGKLTEIDPRLSRYIQASTLFPRLDYLQNRYLAISFTPSIASMGSSNLNPGVATSLPGIPAIPGTASRTIKGFTVPDKIYSNSIPPINIPPINIPGYSLASINIPPVVVPDLWVPDIPGGSSYTVPDTIIPDIIVPPVTIPIPPTKQPQTPVPPVPPSQVLWVANTPHINIVAPTNVEASFPLYYNPAMYAIQRGAYATWYYGLAIGGTYYVAEISGNYLEHGYTTQSEAAAQAVTATSAAPRGIQPTTYNVSQSYVIVPHKGDILKNPGWVVIGALRYSELKEIGGTWKWSSDSVIGDPTPDLYTTGQTVSTVATGLKAGLDIASSTIATYWKAIGNWESEGYPGGALLSYSSGGFANATEANGRVNISYTTLAYIKPNYDNLFGNQLMPRVNYYVMQDALPTSTGNMFPTASIINTTQMYSNDTSSLRAMTMQVMTAIKKAYLAKYVMDNMLTYVPADGGGQGTLQFQYAVAGSSIWATVAFYIILMDGSRVLLPTDFNTTAQIGTGTGHAATNSTINITQTAPAPTTEVLPGFTIPGYTIPGYTIAAVTAIPGFLIPGYTVPAVKIINGSIPGYTIPGIIIPGSTVKYTVPGYTVPDIFIPGRAGVPAVPSLVIPASSFIAASGSISPYAPVYSRAIVYDERLQSWGSCDQPFLALFDFSPINARAINPITGDINTLYSFKNLASTIGIVNASGVLAICTKVNPTSFVEYGDLGFNRSGITRLLEVKATFTQDSGTLLEVYGSLDGTTLYLPMTASIASQNAICHLFKTLTGKWFRIRLVGEFELKHLEFSGESGGKR